MNRSTLALMIVALTCAADCDRRESRPEMGVPRRRVISMEGRGDNPNRSVPLDRSESPGRSGPLESVAAPRALPSVSDVDVTITESIYQRLLQDDGLSVPAASIKVVAADGIVTLRGFVENEIESARIVGIAERTPGVRRVESHLQAAR